MIHVIAFCGRAGSGKSTAAKLLAHLHGIKVFSFAGPLKEMARDTMQFSTSQLYGSQAEKERIDPRYGISPRTYLQNLGVAARERIGKSVWSDACINGIRESKESVVIIDDLRFVSEAEALHAAPGITPYIIRLHSANKSSANPLHQSEAEVDLITESLLYAEVDNTHTGLEDFLNSIEQVLHVPTIKSLSIRSSDRHSLRTMGESRSQGTDSDSRDNVGWDCSSGFDGDTFDSGPPGVDAVVLDRPFFRNGGDLVFGSIVDEEDKAVIEGLVDDMIDKKLLKVAYTDGTDRVIMITKQLVNMIGKYL